MYFQHLQAKKVKLIAKFQLTVSAEAVCAVSEKVGVMGAFVAAEQPSPNFLHTMINPRRNKLNDVVVSVGY